MIIQGSITPGQGMASGLRACQSIGGSIKAQRPFFYQNNLCKQALEKMHNGTLNLDISPYQLEPIAADFYFENIKWSDDFSAENFFLTHIQLIFNQKHYDAIWYLPDPKTKQGSPKPNSLVEIIAPKIPNIQYEDTASIKIDTNKIKVNRSHKHD